MSGRNPIFARVSYYLRRYRRLIVAVTLLVSILNIFSVLRNDTLNLEFDDYAGTFRGTYLSTIKDINYLKSDEFHKKWSLIGYLDDLVNEPIEEPSFRNSEDPFAIIEKFENEQDTTFAELSMVEKAKAYAEVILPETKFQFKVIQDIIYKDAFFARKFINSRLKKWLKLKQHLSADEQKLLKVDDDWFRGAVIDLKDKKLEHNLVSSTEIKNTLSHYKIFSNIFLKSGSDAMFTNPSTREDAMDECSKISKKLFSFLSGDYPIITKFDGQSKQIKTKLITDKSLQDDCFIKSLQMNMKGKGIVVTADDRLVPELSGLLSLLRITGNTLPIQIFHKQDLSLASMKILNDIARDPVLRLPAEVKEFKVPSTLKTLDLMFVDVSEVLKPRFRKYYSGFGMKLLAYMFNTFEEMIMVDTDTVIVDNIEKFFNYPEYQNTGAFFFRDRNVNSFLYEGIVDYFKSYLNYDTEAHYLNIPRVSEETLNNRFFGAFARHFMESGLFAINRREKFDGVVASFTLQMFKLFSGSLHGEKEFIWLGQEYMGNSYQLNKSPAIAIGELSPDKGISTSELCTTHPAHIYDGMDLLWFNSGFLNCKKFESYYKDINYERNKGKSLIELKKEYLSPLHITHGLIPPPAEYAATTSSGEPMRGWTMTQQCSNYMWCAYDVIGGADNDLIPKGLVVTFKPEDTNKWDFLGKLWVMNFNKGYNTGDRGYIEGDAYDELGIDELDVFTEKLKDDMDEDDVEISPVKSIKGFGKKGSTGKVAKEGAAAVTEPLEEEETDVEDIDETEEVEETPRRAKGVSFKGDRKKELDAHAAKLKAAELLGEDEDDEEEDSVADDKAGTSKNMKEDYDGY